MPGGDRDTALSRQRGCDIIRGRFSLPGAGRRPVAGRTDAAFGLRPERKKGKSLDNFVSSPRTGVAHQARFSRSMNLTSSVRLWSSSGQVLGALERVRPTTQGRRAVQGNMLDAIGA